MYIFDPHKAWREQTPQRVATLIEAGSTFAPSAWSGDGRQLLGGGGSDAQDEQIFVYSLDSKKFTRLSDAGDPWTWLNDGRRLLYTYQRKLFVLDSVSKSARELLSVAPDDFDSVAMSHDNRTVYFTRAVQQGNIWLMTLK